MSKNKIAYLIVKNNESESYLYTDIRKVNKKIKELNNECLIFEFRSTINGYWQELYQRITPNNYIEIIEDINNTYTEQYLHIMKILKTAIWNSSINYPENGLHDCKHCGNEIWMEDIRECDICGEEGCLDCIDLDFAIQCDSYIHTDHRYECDGDGECECQLCYNDECEMWNPEDHDGQTKSSYDENREFIMNLDPNDPADAWFFED